MDVVTLGQARAQGDKRYTIQKYLRGRDHIRPLPTLMSSPPTVSQATMTVGQETSASNIQGAQWVKPDSPGSFRYTGCIPSGPVVGSPIGGFQRCLTTQGMYSTNTSAPPWECEFWYEDHPATTITSGSNGSALPQATINIANATGFSKSGGTATVVTGAGTQTVTYTGLTGTTLTGCTGGTGTMATGGAVAPTTLSLELFYKDAVGSGIRILIDDQAVSDKATVVRSTNSGNAVRVTVPGLTVARHRIRLEFSGYVFFAGVAVSATGSISAPETAKLLRIGVFGDSFVEPTVTDPDPLMFARGWVQHLGYRLRNVDMGSIGKGGTGYLNPGSFVKYGDRIADPIAFAPNILFVYGSSNDFSQGTTAQIATAATACWTALKAALPNTQIIIIGPQYWRGFQFYSAGYLGQRDALKSAATALGLPFIDLLSSPVLAAAQPPGVSTASTSVGGTTMPSSVSFTTGTVVQIDIGDNAEMKTVSAVTGTGPYTLTVTDNGQNLNKAHASGVAIAQAGKGMRLGFGYAAGKQYSGDADWKTGTDATHPTWQGHINDADFILWLLLQLAAIYA